MTDTLTSEVDWKSPEAMAWTRCDLEHGLDNPCVRCENLADAFRGQREVGRREGLQAADDRLEPKAYFDGKRPFANQRAAFVRGIAWSKEEIQAIDVEKLFDDQEHHND